MYRHANQAQLLGLARTQASSKGDVMKTELVFYLLVVVLLTGSISTAASAECAYPELIDGPRSTFFSTT